MARVSIPPELESVLVSTPDTLHGAVRFAETRVPLEVFLDSLEEGVSLDRFLKGYPTVKREQAIAVLSWMNHESRKLIGIDAA